MSIFYQYPKYLPHQTVRYINNNGNYCRGKISMLKTTYLHKSKFSLIAQHKYLIVAEYNKFGRWIEENQITEIIK